MELCISYHELKVILLYRFSSLKLSALLNQISLPTYILTYLLTYSMQQSPSWEANRFSASQEIPHILCSPKVHYRTHKSPPPVPILGHFA